LEQWSSWSTIFKDLEMKIEYFYFLLKPKKDIKWLGGLGMEPLHRSKKTPKQLTRRAVS
jgi:hypothetical protein